MWPVFTAALALTGAPGVSQPDPDPPRAAPVALSRRSSLDRTLARSGSHRYTIPLLRGESAEISVTQRGVDVVLELYHPAGERIDSVDGPTGRAGEERLIVVAEAEGPYTLVVRPFDAEEPEGGYRIVSTAWRDKSATTRWLSERAAARGKAVAFLRARAGPVRWQGTVLEGDGLARFDLLAARSRVVGLGEATHGSREFGDARLTLTRRAVERHGVRVIALEGSAARMRRVQAWTTDGDGSEVTLAHWLGSQWIGRRAFGELARFVRQWNRAHSSDLVRLVGLDPQDNAPGRESLAAFVHAAFDSSFAAKVDAVLRRWGEADERAMIFARSDVSQEDWRFLVHLLGLLEAKRPILAARLGDGRTADALDSARDLAQSAEFNTAGDDSPRHSRDWVMAANLLRALGPNTRAVFWAHNAHVAHPSFPEPDRGPTGEILRDILGCGYGSLGMAFGGGSFLAQTPDDSKGRQRTFTVPPSPVESIDGALEEMALGDALAVWECPEERKRPEWLDALQPMHWIGALFSEEWLPHQRVRSQRVQADFDGVLFFRRVRAETAAVAADEAAPWGPMTRARDGITRMGPSRISCRCGSPYRIRGLQPASGGLR